MHRNEVCALRTQLRELNIEYSALVRALSGEASSARMAELRSLRQLLMARIAEVAPHSRPVARAAQAPLDVVVQAA